MGYRARGPKGRGRGALHGNRWLNFSAETLEQRRLLAGVIENVIDLVPGTTSGGLLSLPIAFGGTRLFVATRPETGEEIYVTDGTAGGTTLLKDINPGAATSHPLDFVTLNGVLYFTAFSADAGRELWRTDATAAGTYRVKDINPGTTGSQPGAPTVAGNYLYFSATTAGAPGGGSQAWRSDGTDAGTISLGDFNAIGSDAPLFFLPTGGNSVIYSTKTTFSNGQQLFRSDGTPGGTGPLLTSTGGTLLNPINVQLFNGVWYFSADDGASGNELWRSDGTSPGTYRVKDIVPGSGGSSPSYTAVANGWMYFWATTSATGWEPWRTDGTEANTFFVGDLTPGPTNATSIVTGNLDNGALLVGQSSGEVFRIGADQVPVQLATNVSAQGFKNGPNGLVYFSGSTTATGAELWRTDGTVAGTYMLPESNPGTGAGVASPFKGVVFDNRFYFYSSDPAHGREWRYTDGTTTTLVDLNPGTGSGVFDTSFGPTPSIVDGTIWFYGDNGVTGAELWRMRSFAVLAPSGSLDLLAPAGAAASFNVSVAGGVVTVLRNGEKATFSLAGVNALTFTGGAGNDTLTLAGWSGPVSFAGGGGSDSITLAGGSAVTFGQDLAGGAGGAPVALSVNAGASATFAASQHLASLAINGLAALTPGGNKLIVTRALSVAGTGALDLADNDLAIDYTGTSPLGTWNGSAYSGITRMVQTGRTESGTWTGPGIVTSMRAAADGITTVAISEAANMFGIGGSETVLWQGQSIDATTVIVKYTYAGDANLDGVIDGGDYGIIDNFAQVPNSWGYFNGDFNYDGVIDGGDYGIIDNNIQAQGLPL